MAPVAETAPPPADLTQIETRLKEKGLSRRMGYFLLPEEAQFIRYTNTVERLRVACFHAQKELQDVDQQLARVQSAQAGAIASRMQARAAMSYSDAWRENWNAMRARNQASDALRLVELSKEDVTRWRKDAQKDLDSAVELYGGQIRKLREMFQKLQGEYAALVQDAVVKKAMNELGAGDKSYRLGPTPTALAAVKKLEHEEQLHGQFKSK